MLKAKKKKKNLVGDSLQCTCTSRNVASTILTKMIDLLFFLFFLGKATISNDGATILKTLDIVHPAAKTLVDIAKSQDAEVKCFKVYEELLVTSIVRASHLGHRRKQTVTEGNRRSQKETDCQQNSNCKNLKNN